MSEKDVDCAEHAEGSSSPVVETGAGASHTYLKSRHLYMIAIGGKMRPVPAVCCHDRNRIQLGV